MKGYNNKRPLRRGNICIQWVVSSALCWPGAHSPSREAGDWVFFIINNSICIYIINLDCRLAHYGPSFSWAVTDSMEWVSLSSADPRKPQAFRQVLRCGLTIIIESLLFFSLAIFLLDPQNPNSQKWGAGAREDLGGTLCARGKIESINVEFSE